MADDLTQAAGGQVSPTGSPQVSSSVAQPVPVAPQVSISAAKVQQSKDSVEPAVLPERPTTLPFPPIEENVDKLRDWLLNAFADTAFNNEGMFPAMSGPPGHIHLREGALPKARHKPIPVPFHLKEATKQALQRDVDRGIIAPVPIGTAT